MAPLPLSRHTHTPPAAGKWKSNAELVERIMPFVEPTWRRLESLRAAKDLRSGTHGAR